MAIIRDTTGTACAQQPGSDNFDVSIQATCDFEDAMLEAMCAGIPRQRWTRVFAESETGRRNQNGRSQTDLSQSH